MAQPPEHEQAKPVVPPGASGPAPAARAVAAEKKHETKALPQAPTPGALVVEDAVEIAAPPEAVWKVFTEEQKWPQWNPLVQRVNHRSGARWRLGWQFEFVLKSPPLPPLKARPLVLEVQVPSLIRWFATVPGIDATHWFLFEKNQTGTRVISHEELTGILTPLARLFRGWLYRTIRRWLQALKVECEKSSPSATGDRLPVLGSN